MTITLTTTPPYALPGQAVRVNVSSDTGGVNAVRLWLAATPLVNDLKRASNDRQEIGTVADGAAIKLELKDGGAYSFIGQELTQGATTYGGGYQGDPNANFSETLVGAEDATLKIYMGERLEMPIGTASDRATLVVYVWGDTIRQTTQEVHGVVSPAIINPTSALAEAAVQTSSVKTAVEGLIDTTVSTLQADIWTLAAELVVDLTAHMNNTGGSYHVVADTDNDSALEQLPSADPGTMEGLAHVVRTLHTRLSLHMSNGADGTLLYHQPLGGASLPHPDYENALFSEVPSIGSKASIISALADIYRAYEAHRAEGTPIHANADTTNTVSTSLNSLLNLHQLFLSSMRSSNPSVPEGMNDATVKLSQFGFRRA